MNKINLIPDMIRFTWKGAYWNGKKWKSEECLFTKITTDEREKVTTARAYRVSTSYYGEMDKHSMMPAHQNTTESDIVFYKSVNPDDAINNLFKWLVDNRFIWDNGKVRKYIHLQDDINRQFESHPSPIKEEA